MKTKRRTRIKRTRKRKQKGGQSLQVFYGTREVNGQSFTKEETKLPPQITLPRGDGILIMWDPDAVNGYVHWILPFQNGTPESPLLPYQGPTPPSGTHRYFFDIVPYDRKKYFYGKKNRTPFSLHQNMANHKTMMTVSSSSS